jgi:hypothetical protein
MAQNPNIDDATRARAMKFVADKTASAPAKSRVVSKKELEDSGMSLRDFLNKERGLTRRKSADPTAGEARDKAAQTAADKIDPGNDGGLSNIRRQDAKIKKDTGMDAGEYVRSGKAAIDRQDAADRSGASAMSGYKPRGTSPLSEIIRPGTNTNYENKDASDMGMKRGGKVKKMASGGSASKRADGCALRGKTRA